MSKKIRTDRCINPYNDDGVPHHKGSNLRKISKALLQKKPNLPATAMVCNDCRLKRSLKQSDSSMSIDDSSDISNMECDAISTDHGTDYPNSSLTTEDKSSSIRLLELEELQGLKDKTSLEGNDPMKLRILTIAPESWSIRRISKEFNTSRFLAKKAKELRSACGVLADVTAKAGKTLPNATITSIIDFYNDDTIGRIMPGVKDTCSVKVASV